MKLAMYCREIADAGVFLSAVCQRGDAGASLGGQVSMYAGNNIKEFVAESLCTALVYGDWADQQVMTFMPCYHGRPVPFSHRPDRGSLKRGTVPRQNSQMMITIEISCRGLCRPLQVNESVVAGAITKVLTGEAMGVEKAVEAA